MASPLFPPPDVLGTDWTPPLADVRWVTRKYLDVPYAGDSPAQCLDLYLPEAGEDYGETPYVSAAVDQFGPISFIEMDDQARRNGLSHVDHDEPFSPESRYLGIPVPDAPRSLCIQSNPTTYAGPHMCPLLVQHGTGDRLVPFEQSETFVRRLREKGLGEKVTFVSLPGADHEDDLFYTQENLDAVFAFLDEALGR